MTRYQWGIITICILLNLVDGLDVSTMAFTASSVAAAWQLNGASLGTLLSAGVIGMSIGSIFVAPLADKHGRRPVLILNLLLAGITMCLSFYTTTLTQLAILRVLTGIGVGVVLVGANVTTSEFANTKWRGMAISLQSVGFAIGASCGGLLAGTMNSTIGWHYVFLSGGIITLASALIVYLWMPDSIDNLLARRPANALDKVNALLQKLRQPALSTLPAPATPASEKKQTHYRILFSARYLKTTIALVAAYFFSMFSFYFALSWTPRILETAGMSASAGIAGGTLLNIGGMAGALLFGFVTSRFALTNVIRTFLALAIVSMLLVAPSTQVMSLTLIVGFLTGFFLNGIVAGLYTLAPQQYDASIRSGGVGLALGVGRIGAIASPLVAGFLIDAHWEPAQLYYLYAGALLLTIVVITVLHSPAVARKT